MTKRFDNQFLQGILNAVFTTIFQPKDLPNNFFDLLDINRRKIEIEFDRTTLKISHDVITATFANELEPEQVIDYFGMCREKISEFIEASLPEYNFTMMYFEGDSRETERGPYLMELAIHTMICKMLLMSQMNLKLSFTPEHLWLEIIKKDPNAVFNVHSSLILYSSPK